MNIGAITNKADESRNTFFSLISFLKVWIDFFCMCIISHLKRNGLIDKIYEEAVVKKLRNVYNKNKNRQEFIEEIVRSLDNFNRWKDYFWRFI